MLYSLGQGASLAALTSGFSSFLGALTGALVVFALIYAAIYIIAACKIFEKAGQRWYKALIPFYNAYILYKLLWGNGWFFSIPLLLSLMSGMCTLTIMSVLISIGSFVFYALTAYKKATAFGYGIPFAIGLFFFDPIFSMVIAFGPCTYHGVPHDGTSYRELKEKIGYKEKAMHYDDPNQKF